MTGPILPELPPAKYDVWDDYYEGYTLSPEPEDRYDKLPLFTADQCRAIQLATWRAARDYFVELCDEQEARSNSCYEKATKRDMQTVYASAGTTARYCAAAIRQSSDPKETK